MPLLALLLFLFSGVAHGITFTVTVSALNTGNIPRNYSGIINAAAACSAHVAWLNTNYNQNAHPITVVAVVASFDENTTTASAGTLCTYQVYHQSNGEAAGSPGTMNYDIVSIQSGCPPPLVEHPVTGLCEDPPQPCPEDRQGDQVVMNFEALTGTAVPAFCSSNCNYVPVASDRNFAVGNFTCGATLPAGACNFFQQVFEIQEEELDDGQEQRCGVINGQTVCTSQSQQNCGTINGQEVCVAAVPEGNCTVIPGGSYICDSTAPNQPTAPGDPETPATPDVQFSQVDPATGASDREVNYYGSGTVADSSTPVVGSSNPAVGGASGFGNGSGTGEGEEPFDPTADDSAGGGLDCSAPPSCDGDPIKCALLVQLWRQRCAVDVPASGELLEAAGLDDVPTDGSGLNHESVSFGSVLDQDGLGLSRACPADVTMSLASFGNPVIPLSQYCGLFETVGTLLMMAAWLAAIRIVVGGL
jgi:hypothetical protein